jgi:hypothetical protein
MPEPMTKEKFIEAHRHEIAGWVMDAYTSGRTGAEAACAMRNTMKLIDARLAAMYGQLQPKEGTK